MKQKRTKRHTIVHKTLRR